MVVLSWARRLDKQLLQQMLHLLALEVHVETSNLCRLHYICPLLIHSGAPSLRCSACVVTIVNMVKLRRIKSLTKSNFLENSIFWLHSWLHKHVHVIDDADQ
jgi:hypothetical protein